MHSSKTMFLRRTRSPWSMRRNAESPKTMRSAAGLEKLSLYGGSGGIDIRLSPQVRLKELSFDGVHLPLLRSIHTGNLEKLFVFPSGRDVDYAPLAEVPTDLIYSSAYTAGPDIH